MIANAPSLAQSLTGLRKAAMLLVILGEQAGAPLVQNLSEEEVQVVTRQVARVSQITSEEADTILEEFHQMLVAREYVVTGGIDYAKKMLTNAFGPESAKRLLDRVIKALGQDIANFDALHKADPQQLAKFIHSEHPQTV